MGFLNNKYARILTLVLLLQAVAYYAVASRSELTPEMKPLSTFPMSSAGWRTTHEVPMEKEVADVLRADDILNREYVDPSGTRPAYLLFEFFKTQRTGQSPHSPKNCLPGSGWEPIETGRISVPVLDGKETIVTNKYVVTHGEEKSLVMYWYQSHNRVIASEYAAKFWLVADAIRFRRSDTSMIRIVVPVANNDTREATRRGIEFLQAIYPDVLKQLPS